MLAALAALLLPARDAKVPDVKLSLLDGRTIDLKEWRGRPVLLGFWATSCAPCVEELPDLVQLYRELHPRGLEFVAIAMPYDPPLYVQNFVRQYNVPYPVALDTTGAVVRAFENIKVIPTALLIDPAGVVVFRAVGKLDAAHVRQLVAPLLDGGAKPEPAS